MIKILTFIKQLIIRLTRNERKLNKNEQIPVEHNKQFKILAKKYDGRLLIRSDIQLTDKQLKYLIDRKVMLRIKAIEQSLLNYKCNRCGNSKQSLFGKMPCITCGKQSTYCRNCIEMGRVLDCDYLYYLSNSFYSWPKLASACTWKGTLNRYQLKAAHKLLHNLKATKDTLVWSVTGSGKTEMVFPIINKALQCGQRICIATPRKDVVLELLPRCQQAFKDVPIQSLYGGSKEKNKAAQFVITTTHQLIRFKNAFDVLIIDEVDAFPYHADTTLPYMTKRARKKNGVTIYLTATPRYEQKWKMKLKQLDYIFVPARHHGYPLPVPQLRYSFNLKTYLKRNECPPTFIQWLGDREKQERQLLIFVPTIKLATKLTSHLAQILTEQLIIPNETYITSVHAEDNDRQQKIDLFRQEKLKVLVTTTILERGVTFPSIDVIVLHACHHVFDEAALIQIAGRAGRSIDDPTGEVIFIHEGKTDAIVKAKQSIIEMNKRAKRGRL